MKNIVQIYKKLLGLFKFTKPVDKNDEEYIGIITFKVTKSKDIDILCSLPDMKNQSLEDLSGLSQTYAEFLMYINEGYLKDDILNILQNQDHKNIDNDIDKAKDKLFIDNVLFNWAMLHVESRKKKNKLDKGDQPLIKPTLVFNSI